jgi:hypothetical protein
MGSTGLDHEPGEDFNVISTSIDKLVAALPPGWEIRERINHLYLYYRGWVIAKFSAADTPERIAHGIRWHTGVVSAVNDAVTIRN